MRSASEPGKQFKQLLISRNSNHKSSKSIDKFQTNVKLYKSWDNQYIDIDLDFIKRFARWNENKYVIKYKRMKKQKEELELDIKSEKERIAELKELIHFENIREKKLNKQLSNI